MKNDLMNNHGLVLCAGIVLAAIGLALEPPRASSALLQTTGDDDPPTGQQPTPFPQTMPVMGNADSNNSMIAVTGIDLTGSSILYLVDTVNRQIAIYQAAGGTEGTQGIKFVGARKIDLDLRVEGWNDKSEYSYDELRKQFEQNNKAPASQVK